MLAVILSIYFVHGGDRLFHWLLQLAPAAARPRLAETGRLIYSVIGRYIRGIAVVGAVDGFFIGIALWILGVPLALPLAVLTFIGAFLPVVGAFLAGLLAAVVALVAKGVFVALIVVAVTVAVQQIEGHVLAPQIYGKALDLPGAVILVAIAVGSVVSRHHGRLPGRPRDLGGRRPPPPHPARVASPNARAAQHRIRDDRHDGVHAMGNVRRFRNTGRLAARHPHRRRAGRPGEGGGGAGGVRQA